MTESENRLHHFSLCEKLGGLFNMAGTKHLMLGMHLHDHHVCAHGPTVLTNPEYSESASLSPPGNDMDCIRKGLSENYFLLYIV